MDGPLQKIQNLDAEQELLGALLLEPKRMDDISEIVQPACFSEPLHGRMFEAMLSLFNQGNLNAINLTARLNGDDALAQMGGKEYPIKLMAECLSAFSAKSYAGEIKDKHIRASLDDLARHIRERVRGDADASAHDIMQDIESEIFELSNSKPSENTLSTSESAFASFRESVCSQFGANGVTGVSSGLADIDSALGGFRKGQNIIIAGRPAMGKSLVGGHIAHKAAAAGHGVLFISLEMSREEVIARLVSETIYKTGYRMSYQSILSGLSDATDLEMALKTEPHIHGLPLVIDDAGSRTIASIRGVIRRAARKLSKGGKTLDLVIVDYLQLIRAGDRYRGQKTAEVTEISAELKAIAKEFSIPIITLSQLNRGVEGREDKRPSLHDLRDSGSIEQDADVVIFLYRPEYYLERKKPEDGASIDAHSDWEGKHKAAKNRLYWIVAKQRHGPTKTITTYCDMAYGVVRNAA